MDTYIILDRISPFTYTSNHHFSQLYFFLFRVLKPKILNFTVGNELWSFVSLIATKSDKASSLFVTVLMLIYDRQPFFRCLTMFNSRVFYPVFFFFCLVNIDICHLLVNVKDEVSMKIGDFSILNRGCENLLGVKFDYKLTFNRGFLKTTYQPTTYHRPTSNQPTDPYQLTTDQVFRPIRNMRTTNSITNFKRISDKKIWDRVVNTISRMWVIIFWLKPECVAEKIKSLNVELINYKTYGNCVWIKRIKPAKTMQKL